MSYLKDLDYSVVQQCMHCGMCLPTCPTYMETKLERNSPRRPHFAHEGHRRRQA